MRERKGGANSSEAAGTYRYGNQVELHGGKLRFREHGCRRSRQKTGLAAIALPLTRGNDGMVNHHPDRGTA